MRRDANVREQRARRGSNRINVDEPVASQKGWKERWSPLVLGGWEELMLRRDDGECVPEAPATFLRQQARKPEGECYLQGPYRNLAKKGGGTEDPEL